MKPTTVARTRHLEARRAQVVAAGLTSLMVGVFLTAFTLESLAADDPVLVKAVLSTHTNDEDKDHDTGIYVDVKTSDGSGKIAQCKNADNSGDDGTQYKNNSDHDVSLEIVSIGIKKSACKGFKVHMWQHTKGNDTWRFKPSVILSFSDGTTLLAEGGNTELKNDGASTDFSAPQ